MLNGPVIYRRRLMSPSPADRTTPRPTWLISLSLLGATVAVSALIGRISAGLWPGPADADSVDVALRDVTLTIVESSVVNHAVQDAAAPDPVSLVARALVRQTRTVRVAAGLAPSLRDLLVRPEEGADGASRIAFVPPPPVGPPPRMTAPSQDTPPKSELRKTTLALARPRPAPRSVLPTEKTDPPKAAAPQASEPKIAAVAPPPPPASAPSASEVPLVVQPLPAPRIAALPPVVQPPVVQAPGEDRPGPPVVTQPGAGPRIALVIDDLGLNPRRTEGVIDLPATLTLAFLPYGQFAQPLARQAAARGHEIILHLPMQPHGPQDPGPQALRAGLTVDDFRARIAWAFSRFDGYVGFNNHMGSRLTENRAAMDLLMRAVQGRGLYFLDSLTSGRSVAYAAARDAGLPTLVRHVFLDHDASLGAIRRQLTITRAKARRQGVAIAIGHPYATTMQALQDWIPAMKAEGFTFVPVSAVLTPAARQRLRVAARLDEAATLPLR